MKVEFESGISVGLCFNLYILPICVRDGYINVNLCVHFVPSICEVWGLNCCGGALQKWVVVIPTLYPTVCVYM